MSKKMDVGRVWVDIEDSLVPYFRLNPCEKALYYHLLRHTRLEGKRRLFLSKPALGLSACLSTSAVHNRLLSLSRKGCVKIVERGYRGHLVEVLIPSEVPGCVRMDKGSKGGDLEAANCMRNPKLREAIFRRERGQCFYCLRRLSPRIATMDHVVPAAQGGDNSYRNVVACCFECNTRKKVVPAPEFLRALLREGRLTPGELKKRQKALRALEAGGFKPSPRKNQFG